MSDELVIQPVTEEAQPAETLSEPAPTAEPEPTPAATTVDWLSELDKADPKTLRTHPKIAGMIGSEIQRARWEEAQRLEQQSAGKAAQEAEANMRKLASEDPVAFAEKWLGDWEQTQLRNQLDGMRGQTRSELATAIGKAYHELPEWAELSEKDHETLARALMNKSDDEVLPIFARMAHDIVAEKRAQKKITEWQSKELPKIREAVRQEEAAKLLKSTEGPATTQPKGTPAAVDVWNMTDEQFREYAAKKGLRA